MRSLTDWSGRQILGVILGNPARDGEWFIWDGGVADSTIDNEGHIVSGVVGELTNPELAPAVPPVSVEEKASGVTRIDVVGGVVTLKDSKGGTVTDAVVIRDDPRP